MGAVTVEHEKKDAEINPELQGRLLKIEQIDQRLSEHFHGKITVKKALTRQLVSFQANKERAAYRWFKYKEAFSASLVELLFEQYGVASGKILDPFAGTGTTLFAASEMGLCADGIELLPIGQQIIRARQCLEQEYSTNDISRLRSWSTEQPWKETIPVIRLDELRITRGAYPEATLDGIERYLSAVLQENERLQAVLRFALLCILESISFTRKDGQYLRWDYRSGRRQGAKQFDKGSILEFKTAISVKIRDIADDIEHGYGNHELFPVRKKHGGITLYEGSCLHVMPQLQTGSYDAVMTSPPYCNRYDYTRTYALELAMLGVGEQGLSELRQQMLSCTVENRVKDLLSINPLWFDAIKAADEQALLHCILDYLEEQKLQGHLNNNGIPRMVRGYFYEMACIISECSRVMKSNAVMIMVNDNVRYAGVGISVDIILSAIAEKLGFHVENILVLPGNKGNSSQQMGEHGRTPLRKCVYIWRKA